jgi:transposase
MMNKQTRYSTEFRERVIRLVFEYHAEYDSQWAAMNPIAGKVGCKAETLRKWVRQAERDKGLREGLIFSDHERFKALDRENRELKRANGSCARRQLFPPRRVSSAKWSDGVVYRRAPGNLRR